MKSDELYSKVMEATKSDRPQDFFQVYEAWANARGEETEQLRRAALDAHQANASRVAIAKGKARAEARAELTSRLEAGTEAE